MSVSIQVDPMQLERAAMHIEQMYQLYEKEYRMLFQGVEQLASSWKGKDNQAFASQIRGFEKDFMMMRDIMKEYADFLRRASRAYQQVQNERMMQARRLVN